MSSARPSSDLLTTHLIVLPTFLRTIAHIETFLHGMGPAHLANDQRTVFACQYALPVVSEAAKCLSGCRRERLCPGVPWRDIRGIGNRLRHAYDQLDFALIWKGLSG